MLSVCNQENNIIEAVSKFPSETFRVTVIQGVKTRFDDLSKSAGTESDEKVHLVVRRLVALFFLSLVNI